MEKYDQGLVYWGEKKNLLYTYMYIQYVLKYKHRKILPGKEDDHFDSKQKKLAAHEWKDSVWLTEKNDN
jgi:hypothetical protein